MREIIRRVESITQEIRKKKREIEELEELIREREEEKRGKWEKLDELRGKIDAIIEEIKNTDAYKRLINSFNKVEDLYRQLIDSEYNAGKIFNYLSPFAYTRKIVPLYRRYLVISRKVYLAPEYHGVVQKRRPSPRELFRTIVEHGDVVIPNVRRSIRDDLAELCELGKKLTAEISKEIKIIRFGYGFELGERLAARIPEAKISHVREFRIWELDEFQGILDCEAYVGISLLGHSYSELLLHRRSSRGHFFVKRTIHELLNTHKWDRLHRFLCPCEVYDVLAEMYEELYKKFSIKKEKCDKIIEEMKKVAAPYILSEEDGGRQDKNG